MQDADSTLSSFFHTLYGMEKLFDRLLFICRDRGIDTRNENVAIQSLTGLSSGRVTQIKQAGEAGKLGEKTVARLVKYGYSRDWIQCAIGDPKQHKKEDEETDDDIARFAGLVQSLKVNDRMDAWVLLKKFCLERAADDDLYLSEIVKYITNQR